MKRLMIFLMLCLLVACPALGKDYTTTTGNNWLIDGADLSNCTGLTGNTWIETLIRLPGDLFYVDSGASGAGTGLSWTDAMTTLDAAVALCAADNGDTIFVAPGHTETLGAGADGVDLDVAGISVVGVGVGEERPLFDYDTITDEFVIGADDVSIANLTFKANITTVAKAIDVEAGMENFAIKNCRFYTETTGTDEFTDTIIASAGCDNGLIENCDIEMGAGGAASGINTAGTDYLLIRGNRINGDYSVANIEDATTASIWITIQDNILVNGTVGGTAGLNALPCITLKADTAAVIKNNSVFCDVATPDAAIVAADGYLDDNVYSETEGGVSDPPMWFSTDTVSNIIGIDDAANLGVTTNVVADADGSILERLEQLEQYLNATDTKAGKTYATVMTATSQDDTLFDVDGGAIFITSFVGVVTTQIGGVANTLAIDLNADAGWIDSDFSTAVETNGDIVGTRYTFTNVAESVLVPVSDTAGNTSLMNGWYSGEGMIEQSHVGAGTTGAIKWYMTWIPYADGTTVTAQ